MLVDEGLLIRYPGLGYYVAGIAQPRTRPARPTSLTLRNRLSGATSPDGCHQVSGQRRHALHVVGHRERVERAQAVERPAALDQQSEVAGERGGVAGHVREPRRRTPRAPVRKGSRRPPWPARPAAGRRPRAWPAAARRGEHRGHVAPVHRDPRVCREVVPGVPDGGRDPTRSPITVAVRADQRAASTPANSPAPQYRSSTLSPGFGSSAATTAAVRVSAAAGCTCQNPPALTRQSPAGRSLPSRTPARAPG